MLRIQANASKEGLCNVWVRFMTWVFWRVSVGFGCILQGFGYGVRASISYVTSTIMKLSKYGQTCILL